MLGSVRSPSVCTSWHRWPHLSDVDTKDLSPTTVLETFGGALSGAGWGDAVRPVLLVLVYPKTGRLRNIMQVGHPSATSSQSTYDYGPCYALIQYDYIPRSKISKTI